MTGLGDDEKPTTSKKMLLLVRRRCNTHTTPSAVAVVLSLFIDTVIGSWLLVLSDRPSAKKLHYEVKVAEYASKIVGRWKKILSHQDSPISNCRNKKKLTKEIKKNIKKKM